MNSTQVNILLLALGGLQGLILSLLLYRKKRNLPGYVFLAAYLALMILQVTMKIAGKVWLMTTMLPLYSISYYFPFLYGPLIWLFIRRNTGKRDSIKKYGYHFIPFGAALVSIILYENSDSIPFFLLPLFSRQQSMILQLVSLLIYHGMAMRDLNKYQAESSAHLVALHKSRLIWLRQFTTASFLVCSCVSLLICLMYYRFPHWQFLRFGFVALSIFIYWVSYRAWIQPELFQVLLGGGEYPIKKPNAVIHLVQKYANSTLDRDDLHRISQSLVNKFELDKSYLNPELTIDELAAALCCSRHHLSQAMNEVLGKSFYDCINSYRVDAARILLSNPEKDSYKISSLAFDSGFNSISTFNEVFKKQTGQTPSQFRKAREDHQLRKQRI